MPYKRILCNLWYNLYEEILHNHYKSLFLAQFSRSFVSESLRPHGLQYTRPPCPSPTPGVGLMSIESVMPSNHIILCRLLLLLPSIFPSIRVFSNESALRIRWPKYWSFSFNISPSKNLVLGQRLQNSYNNTGSKSRSVVA